MYSITDTHGTQKFSHQMDAEAYADAVEWQTGIRPLIKIS